MIAELLRDAAAGCGDRPALIDAGGSWSYRELRDQCRRLAAVLRRRGVARLACHVPDSGALVQLLFASALSGVEVCLLNALLPAADCPPLMARFDLSDLVVATPRPDLGVTQLLLGELEDEARSATPLADDSVAREARLIVLTTGTTGTPKGARHSWSRLCAQAPRARQLRDSRWLLAYRLNHFAGLQLVLHVLAHQGSLVIPRSPAVTDVLAALRGHAVDHVSGTPTFWRFLLAQLDGAQAHELRLRQITLGGEAADEALLATLAGTFPGARVSHVYATTEVGSCFSVRDGRPGFPAALLARRADAPARLRIVDGELQVRPARGMLGYYGEPADAGEWRPTGDLVEVRGDRVHFTGRKTEVINVGGAKVLPLPIEALIARLAAVKLVRVYGRPNPVTGHIVAADVVAAEGAAAGTLEGAVRAACAHLPPSHRPRLVRVVPALELVNEKVIRRTS
ncbi:MAG TPA: class I adenylate-forming enzyme family protein [Polyangia bacterium]